MQYFRGSLGVLHIDGLAVVQALVVFVFDLLWAFFSAQAAGYALVHVNVTGMAHDLYREVALLALKVLDLG